MTGWRQWLWFPIWVFGQVFASAARGSSMALAAVLAGAVVGAAWQVVARRDPTERLTWLAGGTLLLGSALMLAAMIGGGTEPVPAGSVVYFASVAAAVVITERVLRRRELGPVTLDMVHAPDVRADAGDPHPGAGRRSDA